MALIEIPATTLIETLRAAARQAVLPRFRDLRRDQVMEKSGPMDLVTVADLEAEALITETLARDWPEARVFGEEAMTAKPSLRSDLAACEWAVILDPVDGTWNFAHGLAAFGMLLAVAHRGQVVWGVNYDPIQDDWIESDGKTSLAMRGGHALPLKTAPDRPVERLQGFVPMALYDARRKALAAQAGLAYGRIGCLRCSAQEYRLLAMGAVDFLLSGPRPEPWDHAAGVLSVIGAGGVARFLDGGPYRPDRAKGVLLAASCEAVWQRVAGDFAGLSRD